MEAKLATLKEKQRQLNEKIIIYSGVKLLGLLISLSSAEEELI